MPTLFGFHETAFVLRNTIQITAIGNWSNIYQYKIKTEHVWLFGISMKVKAIDLCFSRIKL